AGLRAAAQGAHAGGRAGALAGGRPGGRPPDGRRDGDGSAHRGRAGQPALRGGTVGGPGPGGPGDRTGRGPGPPGGRPARGRAEPAPRPPRAALGESTVNLPETLRYDESGLLTVVVQDYASGDVLMVAWANAEAME